LSIESIKHSIEDAAAIYDYLIENKKISPKDISLFGFSFGGAVALELALQKDVRAIAISMFIQKRRE